MRIYWYIFTMTRENNWVTFFLFVLFNPLFYPRQKRKAKDILYSINKDMQANYCMKRLSSAPSSPCLPKISFGDLEYLTLFLKNETSRKQVFRLSTLYPSHKLAKVS